ncbi:hypothetical protein M3Y99_00837800 [Aphelenchoides fujianensis]|nr:hypothetical protein M3Y99_00837800 [Aphelenchoides fujianensis]
MRHLLGLLVGACLLVGAAGVRKFPYVRTSTADPVPWATNYVSTPVDNFNIGNSASFQLKYLLNDTFFTDGGPLFFYTGNEGSVEGFAQNTGIMFDLAPQFNALIVFAEHRYYGSGSSMPYGNASFANTTMAGLLTIEQAFRDFSSVIAKVKLTYNVGKTIAFGGSYGGMLSAWFRMKYPHVVDGAWAASAPVAYFRGTSVQLGDFDATVTQTLNRFGCDTQAVITAFTALDQWSRKTSELAKLQRIFNTDSRSPIQGNDDIANLKAFIREAFENMAMVSYPYPNNFLRPVGAWPLKQACSGLQQPGKTQTQSAIALKTALDAYYGQGSVTCFDPTNCGPDPAVANLGDLRGWDWQSCTEIALHICAQGPPNDVFWQDCADKQSATMNNFETYYKAVCTAAESTVDGYRATKHLDFDAITKYFSVDLRGASNIIVTNGVLDPWSAGAAQIDLDSAKWNQIFSYTIDGAAHHLDLRQPNSCDPASVQDARFQIVQILKCWVGRNQTGDDCSYGGLQWDLPTWDGPGDSSNCQDQIRQYPWGRQKPIPGSSTTPRPWTGSTTTGSTVSTSTGSSVSTSTGSTSPGTSTKGGAGVLPALSLVAALLLALMHVVKV